MFVSLKIKIFVIIAAFFTIVITSNMFYDLDRSEKQLSSYLVNLNKTSAKLLNENVKSNLYNMNYTNIKNTINSFDNEYFNNIYILMENGYIFAQRNSDEIVFEKFKDFDKLLKSNNKDSFVYFQPIKISNKIIGYLIIENNNDIFEKINSEKKSEILEIFIVLLIIIMLVSYVISVIIIKPLDDIIEKIKNSNPDETLKFDYSNDEFSYLTHEIENSHKKIQDLNKNLEKKVDVEVEKNIKKDKMLQDQDLRASLGEMMDAVAHQWMQPLNAISLISQELEFRLEFGTIKNEDISKSCSDTQKQVFHLSDTLKEFRSFFRTNKETENVLFKDLILKTVDLLKNDIISNKIEISIDCNQEEKVNIIPNEFKHVLINLISNAKDAFIQNSVEYRKIDIKIFDVELYDNDKRVVVNIQDNAGGIPKDIIEHVFDANFTSKVEGNGSGIGLYMSKLIIEKIGGTIEVENRDEGACFIISLKA